MSTVMPLGFRRVGLSVSQSTEGKDAKTLPTTNNPLVCRTSLALSLEGARYRWANALLSIS
jgi:hypothetical protein